MLVVIHCTNAPHYKTIAICARQFISSKAHINRRLLMSAKDNWERNGADCTVPKLRASWQNYHDWLPGESMKCSFRYSVRTGPGGRLADVRTCHERYIFQQSSMDRRTVCKPPSATDNIVYSKKEEEEKKEFDVQVIVYRDKLL